ncbi:MAG: pyruvate dehydrogenase (acetyl-transferring) E1 component subunit alpha [Candidatus Caldarchaeum sp.]
MYQVLSPEGFAEEELDPGLLLSMYRDMVYARVLDRWLMRLQRMGRIGIHAASGGQEAAGVGTAYALGENDWIFPLYRELPVFVARKVPISDIVNRNLSNRADPLKGRDFAVYGDIKYRIVPAPIPVAVHIPSAVGFALSLKYKKLSEVVINYFGDGATSKGDFHEALNFAGVFKAPIVFVCVNNQYAISVPVSRQTAVERLSVKAVAYGFEGVSVDGNDVVACYLAAKRAVEKARRGEGPTLIEAVTYRIGPHTTADDPSRYRDDEEVEMWRRRDPITRLRSHLLRRGLWSMDEDEKLWQTAEETIRKTIEECEKNPPLPPESILEDVYATPPWHLIEEKEEFSQLR